MRAIYLRPIYLRLMYLRPIYHCITLLFLYSAAVAVARAEDIHDPFEKVNRGIFSFNDTLDVYVLEPVAREYDEVLPQKVKKGVGNFFENIKYPKYFVSDLVQGKFTQALHHTGRFIINSTVGILGLVDVAKEFGLEHHEEDFGIALAYDGVGAGPYLVLPILGPSTLRDGFGRIVDTFLDPFTWLSYSSVDDKIKLPIIIAAKALELIDTRADLLEAIKTAKESSVDYYGFIQSAYYQHRRGVLYDGNPPDEDNDTPIAQDPKAQIKIEALDESQAAEVKNGKAYLSDDMP